MRLVLVTIAQVRMIIIIIMIIIWPSPVLGSL